MAHGLSQTNRFGGLGRFPHSVAMHAVLTSAIARQLGLSPDVQFECLHHDDTEAFIGDVQSPWKALLADYQKIEHALEASLRSRYKLPAAKSDDCKLCDEIALCLEAHYLFQTGAEGFGASDAARAHAAALRRDGWRIIETPWRDARDTYLETHELLCEETKRT